MLTHPVYFVNAITFESYDYKHNLLSKKLFDSPIDIFLAIERKMRFDSYLLKH